MMYRPVCMLACLIAMVWLFLTSGKPAPVGSLSVGAALSPTLGSAASEAASGQEATRLPLPARFEAGVPAGGERQDSAARQQENVIRVGPTGLYRNPSEAAAVAKDGDTIEIEAAEYHGDVAIWRQNGLTLRGVGGRPHLRAGGRNAEGKAIWVIKGHDTVVEGIEFSGAQVPDLNGAGIRQEGKDLTVRNSVFHGNQMGILTSNNPESSILIEFSEFYHNVVDYDKYGRLGHNIYVGEIGRFILRGSYVHGAITGNNVKSRARENIIANNLIIDGHDGGSSYLLDLSNGGAAYVVGNLFHQSERADNYHMLSYAPEGDKYSDTKAYLINNTFVNDRRDGYALLNKASTPIKLLNNLLVGAGQYVNGIGVTIGNLQTSRPYFQDEKTFDYRLTARSPAIDRGVELDPDTQQKITPSYVYRHPMQVAPRPKVRELDVGAYEFAGEDPDPAPLCRDSSFYPLNLLFASCS